VLAFVCELRINISQVTLIGDLFPIFIKETKLRSGVVINSYNLASQEAEIMITEIKACQGKSLQDLISTNSWAWWYTPVIPAIREI
jgi:hypothetical protein